MASTGEVWKLGHRPALDGVRGIAILLVLACHVEIPVLPNAGKIGVAVFFALSGFLITSLLLEERVAHGSISLRQFFVRRAARLVPAQVACVVVVSALLVGMGVGSGMWTPAAAAGALLYVKNFMEPGTAFGHFWSLAVEEQFYLLWAPMVAGLLIRVRVRALVAVALGCAAVSLVTRLGASDLWAWPIGLAANLDAIFLGCALAAFMHGRAGASSVPRWTGLAGLLVLLGLSVLPAHVGLSWGPAVAGVVTVGMIYAAAQGFGGDWLAWGALRWLGRRSYAIYLWHYPVVLIVWTLGAAGWVMTSVVVLPVTWALTLLSWWYVEAPFLRMRNRRSVGRVEAAQREPDQGVVLPRERLHLGGDLRVRR